MTEVYINSQRVYLKENSTLKLTIENTTYEGSGEYTLDVVLPLYIEANMKVFGHINRFDVSKKYRKFDAMIMVKSKVVFKGSAKITNITESEVKLQFLSGNSSVRFWTNAEKMYIDELKYEYTDNRYSFDEYVDMDTFLGQPIIKAGSFPGRKGQFCYVPILDESSADANNADGLFNGHWLLIHYTDFIRFNAGENPVYPFYIMLERESISPNLMFIVRWIIKHLGYTIKRNDIDTTMVNSIYIATARRTTIKSNKTNVISSSEEMAMAAALPHWTIEEFFNQLQNLFNVYIIFNDIDNTVDLIHNASTDETIDITGSVIDEYEVEIIDDEDVSSNIFDSNIKYKAGESEYHGTEIIDREAIESFTEINCTAEESMKQWDEMSDEDKKVTIWSTEDGHFCAKINIDNKGNETLERVRFNQFGPLVRNSDNTNDIELKITPVATTVDGIMPFGDYTYTGKRVSVSIPSRGKSNFTVVCLQNQFEQANSLTVWDAINGTTEDGASKEDVMQIFFMDDKAVPSNIYEVPIQVPFTHWLHNQPNDRGKHEKWSFALSNDNSDAYIGQFHTILGTETNRNAEYRIKFVSDNIPSVYAIYMIRNKKYICKKLEVQFGSEGLEKVINGYFEEML